MSREFNRLAIVNRGEPAMRIIHTIREYNLERRTAISTIALATEPDRHAWFVREADEAVEIGPATFIDEHDGRRRSSYLDLPRIERVLREIQADAAWAGWGFVAERPDFVEMCDRLGVLFIGPDAASMRRLGDKICGKRLAEQIGIPVTPWAGAPAESFGMARRQAQRLGYPVLVKATAGAGGRGIRLATSERELATAYYAAREEASRGFGDATVFVERWMAGVRHVEAQIQADRHGTIWTLGLRDCSVQRRFQKLFAEAPSPAVSVLQEQAIRDAAVRLCRAADYRDAATVEFLLDPASQSFMFNEVNPRLQVEHAVTELTTGVDLVKLELDVARGLRLEGGPPPATGHAIEVRLNAEDPDAGFAAAPGVVELFRMPTGPGFRVDSGVAQGDQLPSEFGSMFAKLSARGRTRDEAVVRLERALAESVIVIAGGTTNRAFLMRLLEHEDMRRGTLDVGWLGRVTAEGGHVSDRHAAIALVQGAIDAYDREMAEELARFYAGAARLRPVARTEVGRQIELGYRGHYYQFKVYQQGSQQYRVDVDGARLEVYVESAGPRERWLTAGGRRYRVLSQSHGFLHLIEVEGVPHRITEADAGLVRAPSPAMVVAVHVQAGDRVSAGDRLVVLEAMKMEMPVVAPFSGMVRQVLVTTNSQVAPGAPLLHMDPVHERRVRGVGPRVVFDGSGPGPRTGDRPVSRARAILTGVRAGLGEFRRSGASVPPRPSSVLNNMRRLVLGFDLDSADARRLVGEYARVSATLLPDDPELLKAEDEILDTFADLTALGGRQVIDAVTEDGPRLSGEQYFSAYLREVESRGADLPPTFIEGLSRALAHYDVSDLAPTDRLREALLWIFKAQKRQDVQVGAVQAILERRLAHADALPGPSRALLGVLDRLVVVSEGRFPALGDLARDVRYRYFQEPIFEATRAAIHREVEDRIRGLAGGGIGTDRAAHIQALVDCPLPLEFALSRRFETASVGLRRAMLEVLTRRLYRIRFLGDFEFPAPAERAIALTTYEHDGRQVSLVATHSLVRELREALSVLAGVVAGLPGDSDVVVDLHLWRTGPFGEADRTATELGAMLSATGFDRPLRLVTVMVTGPDGDPGRIVPHDFAFRFREGAYVEERSSRGIHPMTAKRLELWRLDRFFLERIASVDGIYLFRAVARENAKDERLFAFAEAWDTTADRDGNGQVSRLPYVEGALLECLTALRRAQVRRPVDERLHWNRVIVSVRQPLLLDRDVLQALAQRIGTQAEGLGLEKILLRAMVPRGDAGDVRDTVLSITPGAGRAMLLEFEEPGDQPVRPLGEYAQKVVRMRQRGMPYPYEIIKLLTPSRDATGTEMPPGDFVEHDLDADGRLVPVDRPYGQNQANVVVGVIRNFTPKYPEGMSRVVLLGDPSKEVGSLARPECERIRRALDLAEQMQAPLEWFAVSAGAKISMESGTENMDWIALVLRRLIEYTQAGHEVNIVITGITVGGQPYWNAEATMLMHTRGILIQTADGAMVLTGKTALDYSGSVSAEDNQGIGGYEHIMGPNGQAQYRARDVTEACRILLHYYDHTYVAPGERFPRRAATGDLVTRDVCEYPHEGMEGLAKVGDIFSNATNPGRKRQFDIRKVMRATSDQDHEPLERWAGMRDAETVVVWDAHIGGYPVALLGLESRQLPRIGVVPPDGPDQWTSGTLFPMSSKKMARAINAASGNRPLVILANLSGFDGSPESMRRRQLEFGAEIGRAVVNFAGPIVFVVISRYHGGAFVVFSKVLNENMEVVALEGSYASVIGGAPAAAVVFAREVDGRTKRDARLLSLEKEMEATADTEAQRDLRQRRAALTKTVRSEKLGEVADEFDRIHSIDRALKVGSLHRIIKAAELRPYLIDAIEQGMRRELERLRQ